MRRDCYFTQEIPAEEKKKINVGTIKRLIRYAIPYKKTFTLIFCLVVFTALISLLPNLLLRYIINEVIPVGSENMSGFYLTIGGFLLLGLLQVIVPRIYGLLLQTKANAIIANIRDEFFDKLQTLSFDFFDSRPVGKISICVTSYVDEIATFFSGYLISFIVNLLQIVIVTVCMVAISPVLSLVIYSAIIPLTVCYVFLRKFVRNRFRKQRYLDANRNAFTLESISGERIIKSFNRVEEDSDIYKNDIQEECINNWFQNLSRYALFGPVFQLFWNYGTLMIYFVGILCIQKGIMGIDAGTIILFINYLGFCSGPFLSISNMLSTLASITTNMEKIFEVLDTESTVTDKPDAIELPTVKGAIEFEHVDFEYKENHLILKDVNLKVNPGEMIALVGPTGAGKTTFINLLTRFYDVKNGVVRIDGTDIRDVTLHSLRSEIGVIMQDPFLFKGTLIDNIRYGRADADDEECMRAAETIHADKVIKRFADGYQHTVGENGDGLSAGEKQMISMARIILKNPSVIILDEATSSIDSENEALIQEALGEILRGKTSFVVAHRLSTVRRADRILYIADHGIAEEGNHEQLMAKKGLYYQLNQKA